MMNHRSTKSSLAFYSKLSEALNEELIPFAFVITSIKIGIMPPKVAINATHVVVSHFA